MAASANNRKYVNCSVLGCINTSKTCGLTFFSLPVDAERRENWLRLISREDLIDRPSTHHRVCEDHFDVIDIIPGQSRKTLKKKVVPTLKIHHVPKLDATTQTDRTILTESSTQTYISKLSQGVQTLKKYAEEPKKKLKLEPEAEEDPLAIRKEEPEESEEAQKEMFHKLCDKYLTKKLAKLVKAQTE